MNIETTPNWFEAHRKSAATIVALLCLTFVEIIIRIGVALELVPYQSYPTQFESQFWGNIDPVVGYWRYPNKTFRIVQPCVDETYRTNSVGARDPERSLRSNAESRVVVLGDSFTEGWGVGHGARITDILESETGIEHLNFGTSSWGTIQQWLYYQHYAQAYDHSAVMLLLFPQNDYDDNNPDEQNHGLYRPYLRKTNDGHEVWYTVDFDKRYLGENSRFSIVKNTIDNHWYLANVLRTTLNRIKHGVTDDEVSVKNDYDNYTTVDMERLLHVFGEIAKLAGDRPFYIVTIPGTKDFEFARKHGTNFQLIATLEAFAEQTDNVKVIDLLPWFIANAESTGRQYRDYTLGCNSHWSATGNRVAADALLRYIYAMPGSGVRPGNARMPED